MQSHKDFDAEAQQNDSSLGTPLYEIAEKSTECSTCTTETVELRFYDHVLLYRRRAKWCCFPEDSDFNAVPRFKIVNVSFTNQKKKNFHWAIMLGIVGILLFTYGLLVDNFAVLVVGILILFGVAPAIFFVGAFCGREGRYVTFDIKGSGSTTSWFSSSRTIICRFEKQIPNEDFIVDYVYGPLKKGCNPMHVLSHLNAVALAAPLQSRLTGAIENEAWDGIRSTLPVRRDPVPTKRTVVSKTVTVHPPAGTTSTGSPSDSYNV